MLNLKARIFSNPLVLKWISVGRGQPLTTAILLVVAVVRVSTRVVNGYPRAQIVFILSAQIVQQIATLPHPRISANEDRCSWKINDDGSFSTKYVYLAVKHMLPSPVTDNFNLVWRWPGPERICLFFWKALLEIILTNAERFRRHMSIDALYVRSVVEIVNGYFKPFVTVTESRCCGALFLPLFVMISSFGVVLDCIWFARNKFVLANKSCSFRSIFFRAQGIIQASLQGVSVVKSLKPLAQSCNGNDEDNWTPPPLGYVKINVDGLVRNGGSSTGCGGVAMDHNGEFLFAFYMKLNGCPEIATEAWAMFHSLRLAWDKSYKKII